MTKTVISLCDRTGNMVLPWARAGFECICVDTQEGASNHPNIVHRKTTVEAFSAVVDGLRDSLNVVAVFAFPPCTDLAVSGARWFKEKEKANPKYRELAMGLVYACRAIAEKFSCPYFLENPVSVISSEWRKPNYTFHPYEFGGYQGGEGDKYTKRTCLWSGGGFTLPPKRPIDPTEGSKMWRCSGGKSLKTKNYRSATPMGFARAVFEHLTRGN